MDKILNIGDEVRFLNDVGGGRISGFRKGGIVLVEDEDGFEVPVIEQEVVLVNKSEKKITSQTNEVNKANVAEQPKQPEVRESVPLPLPATEGIEERMARLERMVKKLQLRIEQLETAKSLRERLQESGMKVTESKKNDKAAKGNEPLEIDLHAEELLDTTAGMQPADIKEYQLDVFRRTMQENIKNKGKRIVFIHGNGDGVLRRAILSELRRDYSRCEWQDASFQQYGFGATMVTIR